MAINGAMAANLMGIFQMLPTMLSYMQILIYVIAVLFFGSIAVAGFRGFLTWPRKLLLRLVLGAMCVVTGVAITPFVRINNDILSLLQLDSFIGMLVSSIILLVCMHLMTLNIPYSVVLKERIKRLTDRLEKREDKNAKMPENRLKHPATIAGLVLFIAFMGFSLLNFHGFPDMKHDIYSSMGMSESDIASMNDALGQYINSPLANVSANCMAALQEMQGKEGLTETVYENDATKAAVESAAGGTVSEMYKLESGGRTLISPPWETASAAWPHPRNSVCAPNVVQWETAPADWRHSLCALMFCEKHQAATIF